MVSLNGLAQYTENGGIDKEFKNRGIESLLQISYFRMVNAMNEAINKRENPVAFSNQIELIHQEIQGILAIACPYGDQALAEAVVQKLATGVSPSDLEKPKIHLKASAMRCLSSILAACEEEKGKGQLKVAVSKHSYYYASNDNLKLAKAHQLYVWDKTLDRHPVGPIDLFICEFHHNILDQCSSYQPENVVEEIKAMVDKGLVANKFTVVIDTTIGFDQLHDVKELLEDESIKSLIRAGKLNVVLLRSTQKFDMLGLDNFYGGLTTTFNTQQSFDKFNARMNLPEDQLKGLNYQGLTHLQRYASFSIDAFRQGVMDNTQKLYRLLPPKAIYHQGSHNPMQMSQILDPQIFFLDIKFPHYPKSAEAFIRRLLQFTAQEKLFFTTRPSFSFMNTNMTVIDGKKMRFSLGLEDEKTLQRYADFFRSVQSAIDRHEKKRTRHERCPFSRSHSQYLGFIGTRGSNVPLVVPLIAIHKVRTNNPPNANHQRHPHNKAIFYRYLRPSGTWSCSSVFLVAYTSRGHWQLQRYRNLRHNEGFFKKLFLLLHDLFYLRIFE